jgi:branched-chain amino acid transport system ATP-binding protein
MLLEVDSLVSGYGVIEVLHGITMHVEKGEVVAIIGPNGAGKSTLLKTIYGLIPTRSGITRFNGEPITGLKSQEIVKRRIALVPQERSVFPSLTVEENLEMGAFIRNDKGEIKKDIERIFKRFPIIERRRKNPALLLSGGERQVLGIARALMLRPEMILLDEPSTGLAPKVVREVFNIVQELNGEGTSVLLVEQNARMALSVADRAYVLEAGRIHLEGRGSELMHDDRVRKIYLGEQ